MNLLLLQQKHIIAENKALLTDADMLKAKQMLQRCANNQLTTGLLQNKLGLSKVLEIKNNSILLELNHKHTPLPKLELSIILAMPRPKVLNRLLAPLASLGIKSLDIVNSQSVEKSYWHTHYLREENINAQLLLGLEQARDTILPQVNLHRSFRSFVENKLCDLLKHANGYFGDTKTTSQDTEYHLPSVLFIGGEGGFTPYEKEKLLNAKMRPYSLGSRILKVETSVLTSIGKFL